MDTFRESFAGQLIYFASGRRVLQYAEEKPGFVLPEKYRQGSNEKKPSRQEVGERDAGAATATRQRSGSSSEETIVDDQDARREGSGQQGEQKEEDKSIIVDWYGPDDPENPKNWSLPKKCWLVAIIMLLTSSVYAGSSIYSPSIYPASQYFGVGVVTSTLGLSLFVAGYGIGPLFLSPISEIPAIGRTFPYVITLAIFCVLQVPTALVDNFAGLAILRFIAGFIGSPPLATGGASLQDVFAPHKLPYAMGLYGLSAGAAPALAPVFSGFAVQANGWRWAFWEMLWLTGFTLILLVVSLPETNSNTILLHRAARLRRLTGNKNLRSQSEIDSANITPRDIALMTLVRPFSMAFTEPIVLAINLYIGLMYAILYSYFESFPIVFGQQTPGGYGWNAAVANLPFLSLFVGAIISYAIYCLWNRFYFEDKFIANPHLAPEARLPMSMLAAFCFPICLFWFAWSSNRTHWISTVIAAAPFGMGLTWMFMPFLTYLPHAYPEFAASVLASNDFFRSMMGAGMPLAAHGLFVNLGIDWGNTLLGCLTVLFIPIPFILFRYGAWLRNHSPRALHDEELKKRAEDEEANA